MEARLSTEYAAKGMEWLAETVSPFFRKFDFYNKESKFAVSLKSVNAEKSVDFKNILTNIEELKNLKNSSTAQFGREFVIKDVRLDIVIPKGYDRNNLKKVTEAADTLK